MSFSAQSPFCHAKMAHFLLGNYQIKHDLGRKIVLMYHRPDSENAGW